MNHFALRFCYKHEQIYTDFEMLFYTRKKNIERRTESTQHLSKNNILLTNKVKIDFSESENQKHSWTYYPNKNIDRLNAARNINA